MIKSFFDTKIRDIVKEDFWKGYSEKNIWTDRDMIFDLFPEAKPDFTVADILEMLKKENKNYDGKDLNKTAMLLFWLSVAITHSENNNVKKFLNQSIDKYFSSLHKKCPEATGRAGYFEDKRIECLCFIDDCFQYERRYGSADEYEKIDNTIGSAIAISVSVLSKPEFYYDENLPDKNDYLIGEAEQCLSDIIYAPFFYAYEKL
ncbi:MAG: hypothetical protein IKK32_04550 [Oscillospiraceae bacterium]|nr:hypothetical protein [Oscillospiraceae bacterium]